MVAPTTLFQTTYPILFHHLLEMSLTILYAIDKTFQQCIPVPEYLINPVFHWNNLNNAIRETDTFVSFRSTFKNEVLGNTHVPTYFMKGQRRLAVLHARLRNNCSDLHVKCDLFHNHLTDSLSCSCGYIMENAEHYFFECDNYRD